MQEKRVRSLIQLDPTCHKAIKPMCHNYWACALEPRNPTTEPTYSNYWSLHTPEPMLRDQRSHCDEKPMHHNKE